MTEEPQRESGAAAAAEKVRAILEAAERETDAQLRRVRETTERLSTRADEIERELDRLAGGVREAIQSLREELAELRGGTGAASEPVAPAAGPDVSEEVAVAAEPAADPPDAPPGAAGAGSEGARVIALNMALSGAPREQTASYLAENFELDDPAALLDEVYARVSK